MGARGCAQSTPPRSRDQQQLGASGAFGRMAFVPGLVACPGCQRDVGSEGSSLRGLAGMRLAWLAGLAGGHWGAQRGAEGQVCTTVTCSVVPSPAPVPQLPQGGSREGRMGTELRCPCCGGRRCWRGLLLPRGMGVLLSCSPPVPSPLVTALGSDVSPRAGEAWEETAAWGEPSGPRTQADGRTDEQTA